MDFIHARPDHECAPIEHVVEKRKEFLKNSVSALEKKLTRGNEALQVTSVVEEKFKSNTQKAKESIINEKERVKDILLQRLEENVRKRCDEVDEFYKSTHEKVIAKQQKEIQSFVNEVNVSYDLAKKILENGTSVEVIESERMVAERLGAVEKEEKIKITQINDVDIEYVKKPIDVKQLEKFLELGDVKLKGNETPELACSDYVRI
jgi:deoxyribodipyrimidine photolyase